MSDFPFVDSLFIHLIAGLSPGNNRIDFIRQSARVSECALCSWLTIGTDFRTQFVRVLYTEIRCEKSVNRPFSCQIRTFPSVFSGHIVYSVTKHRRKSHFLTDEKLRAIRALIVISVATENSEVSMTPLDRHREINPSHFSNFYTKIESFRIIKL